MNDRLKVVTMAQELAEALPEQMSRLRQAEDLLKDLIAFFEKSEAQAQADLADEFLDIVARAKQLIRGREE